MDPRIYELEERAAEKQDARDRDAEALQSGLKSVVELRAENGLIQRRGRIREKR